MRIASALFRTLVVGAFFFTASVHAQQQQGVPTPSDGSYTCGPLRNDDRNRWGCKCKGIEACERMTQKECGKNRTICNADRSDCTCTQAFTRPTVKDHRSPSGGVMSK